MNDQQKEIERLRRLREKQLSARDPLKQTRRDMSGLTRREKQRAGFTFSKLYQEMDHKWQGLVIGFLIGLLIAVVVGLAVPTTTGAWIALLGLVIPPVFGFVFGASLDWRDDIRRF